MISGLDSSNNLILSLVTLATGATAYYVWRRSRKRNFPPGPPGLPVLGNVFDIPSTEPWRAFKKLGEKYGDLVHIHVLTQDAIIVNSYEAIKDLFEQRSQNYSSRPYIPGNEMLDFTWTTGFLPYTEEWKTHRKIFHQAFRAENLALYRPMQSTKTRQLLKNMNHSPSEFVQHFRTYSTAITMAATYDYHPAPRDDPMVNNLKELDNIAGYIMSPEKSAIFAAFPLLMRVPPWFPGAAPQRAAAVGRKLIGWWLTSPIQYVKERIANGSIAHCIVGEALSRVDDKQTDAIRLIKGAAASSLLAASDTTDSALQVFVLAMTLYPEVQKRAQAEIQAVVGSGRLPDFSDRPNMPYIDAVVRETLRWHPVLPFSLVRSVLNDDVYRGYHFPKGVTIIPNVWAIAHDETKYTDPSTFNPNRFLDEEGKLNDDTVQYAFGFGRRICVGRMLADASMFSAVSSLLAVFSFEAPLDEVGNPVKIEPRFTAGVTSHPKEFPCRITLRMDEKNFASMLETAEYSASR